MQPGSRDLDRRPAAVRRGAAGSAQEKALPAGIVRCHRVRRFQHRVRLPVTRRAKVNVLILLACREIILIEIHRTDHCRV